MGDLSMKSCRPCWCFRNPGKWHKELTLTRWGSKDPKYDLRPWNKDRSECLKGITLTKEELKKLKEGLGGIDYDSH